MDPEESSEHWGERIGKLKNTKSGDHGCQAGKVRNTGTQDESDAPVDRDE